MIIILTGSTGNLGSYLLRKLLDQDEITKVYCLNRAVDAHAKQAEALRSRGLSPDLDGDRVEFYQANLVAENFGLDKEVYDKLMHDTSLIIHNAWPVDFNRNFKSFAPSIKGVRNLISFATTQPSSSAASRPQAPLHENTTKPILFISSISIASNWAAAATTSRAQIPEAELIDWKLAVTGYGQSKLVSERLLVHASKTLSLPVSIVRVGQLAGPVNGEPAIRARWPDQEWLPSLIKSSGEMRMLPGDLGPADNVDWVPVDISASVIFDLVKRMHCRLSDPGSSQVVTTTRAARNIFGKAKISPNAMPQFFHLVNPHITSWFHLIPAILPFLPSDTKVTPYVDWVEQLRSNSDYTKVHAMKLLDWFEHLQDRAIRFPKARSPSFNVKESMQRSETLAALPEVGIGWMEVWCRQWFGDQDGK